MQFQYEKFFTFVFQNSDVNVVIRISEFPNFVFIFLFFI